MERVKPEQPSGYALRDQDAVAEILAVEAELLRSEGLDPKSGQDSPRPARPRAARHIATRPNVAAIARWPRG